jgi:hypothetical protein
MKYFGYVWLRCSKKRFIIAVEASGKISAVNNPSWGATAA